MSLLGNLVKIILTSFVLAVYEVYLKGIFQFFLGSSLNISGFPLAFVGYFLVLLFAFTFSTLVVRSLEGEKRG